MSARLSFALSSILLFALAAVAAAGDITPQITASEWRMTSAAGETSVYKFYPDHTWQELRRGGVRGGHWRQTAENTLVTELHNAEVRTFRLEDNGAALRREDGPVWKAFPIADARLEPAQPDPALLRSRILTPPPPDTPRLNGPRVFGARPGSVFLYTIPATGKRPVIFSAAGLPSGLALDPATGQITGRAAAAGEYNVTLRATNALGVSARVLKIIIGDKIALTPPLGWNSWNCWGGAVDQEKTLAAARAMVASGLAAHGWSYINIDDGWQGARGGIYNAIQPNPKFPDMKKLAGEIHALGLRFGLYSGPWVGTYAGHVGAYSDNPDGSHDWLARGEHAADSPFRFPRPRRHYRHGKYSFVKSDARQWADWGVDYLKYDWKPNDYYHAREMLDALRATGRDIIYSISNNAPYADAPQWAALTNAYRTTGDISDTWASVGGIGFAQAKWAAFSGPGHWADPDMLVVGHTGGWGGGMYFSRLTPDEQYTHISLWALLSAPMLLGCDLEKLDDFTLNLLTNDEVLDINQDPLGRMAVPLAKKNGVALYMKHLDGGAVAVGLFNKNDTAAVAEFSLADLGLRDTQTLRDVWRQKDLPFQNGAHDATVPAHGVLLLKLSPGNPRE